MRMKRRQTSQRFDLALAQNALGRRRKELFLKDYHDILSHSRSIIKMTAVAFLLDGFRCLCCEVDLITALGYSFPSAVLFWTCYISLDAELICNDPRPLALIFLDVLEMVCHCLGQFATLSIFISVLDFLWPTIPDYLSRSLGFTDGAAALVHFATPPACGVAQLTVWAWVPSEAAHVAAACAAEERTHEGLVALLMVSTGPYVRWYEAEAAHRWLLAVSLMVTVALLLWWIGLVRLRQLGLLLYVELGFKAKVEHVKFAGKKASAHIISSSSSDDDDDEQTRKMQKNELIRKVKHKRK